MKRKFVDSKRRRLSHFRLTKIVQLDISKKMYLTRPVFYVRRGWVVRAGVNNKDDKGGVEASFKQIRSHPEYNWPQMYYDIGVALLNES